MRVGVLIDALARHGGVETYLGALHEALVEAGHALVVFTAYVEVPVPYPVERVRVRAATRAGRVLGFARAVRDLAADVDVTLAFRHVFAADVYMPHGGVVAAAWAGRERALGLGPLRRALRARWRAVARHPRVLDALERAVVGRARAVVAISQRVAAELRERHPSAAPALALVPLGVDLERFAPQGPRAALPFAAPAGPLALFAGYNARLKGLRHAVDAVRSLAGARLLVCGPGQRAVARALGGRVPEAVHVLGPRADMPALYRAADVLLHPTYYDPCSLVVLEALACGTPCVTTHRNGASEVGGGGLFLVDDPADVAGLARGVEDAVAGGRAVRDAARRSVEGRDARSHFAALLRVLESASRGGPHAGGLGGDKRATPR